eukprot:1990788-Pyramimonas_sp.AAC.2
MPALKEVSHRLHRLIHARGHKRRSMLLKALRSAQGPESTVGQPMAVCRQGIYTEYSMEYSKCRALN